MDDVTELSHSNLAFLPVEKIRDSRVLGR